MRQNKKHYSYWLLHLCKIMAWPSWWIVYHRRYFHMPEAFKRSKIKGPGLIVCNHNHWIEAPLVAYTFPFRSMTSIISDVVLTNPFGKWFFNQIGTIVINNKSFEWNDFKQIIDRLKDNRLVLIFPEGTVNRTKTLVQFKEGLVTIAYLANVPIYPIYIDAKHRPLHCQNIMLGKSLHLRDHFHTLNTKTSKMMTKMVYDYVNLMKKKLEEKLRK